MKRYDMSRLMKKAWSLFRQAAKKVAITFSEALRKAWQWIKVQAAASAKVEATAEALGIVEEYHKGRIFVKQSEVGKGTTFRIELKK